MNSRLSDLLSRTFLIVAALAFSKSQALAVGAVTPFVTVEAESGQLSGGAEVKAFVIGSPVPTVATPELEASGGAYVALTAAGQSVSWKNPVPNANALVVRASVPDTAEGGGQVVTLNLYVDGVLRQAVPLSSKQSWVYRKSTTTPDDPNGGGMAYHFYNDNRTLIAGQPIPAGATLMLRKDAANPGAFYHVDCVDLESVAGPVKQPPGSLSVVDYGADPAFTKDSTEAIQKCVADARTKRKVVWIPTGKFMVNSLATGGLDFTGVTVSGAGVWFSMIYRNIPLPPPKLPWRSAVRLGTNSVLRDVSIDSNAIYKAIGGVSGDDYGITSHGSKWLIDRVWVQHCDAQWLTGSDGTIQNSRVSDSWADGINVNNGNRKNPEAQGMRLTVQNNFIRGSGDDCIATYSDAGDKGDNSQMDGTKILNNTTVAPWWANSLRVAGGKNVLVQGNLVSDSASNNGMDISIFGKTGQPLESATITGNVILRGGGWNATYRYGVSISAATNVIFTNNVIRDSRRNGLEISGEVAKATLTGNVIDHPAGAGVEIADKAKGSANFQRNTVRNLLPNQPPFRDLSKGGFSVTQSGNGW